MSQRTDAITGALDRDWKTTREIIFDADLEYTETNRNQATNILRRLVKYGLAERRTIGTEVQ